MPETSARSEPVLWLTPALVVAASFALGGGLIARDLYQPPSARDTVPVTTAVPSALPMDKQPGSPVVQLSPDAARHPHDQTVRRLLQAYFDGINGRNYERWKTGVTSARIRSKSEREWLADFRSTKDGSIVVHRIESAPEAKLRVLLSFTSTQDVIDAPETLQEPCIRWWLTLPVALENNQWKIDTVVDGTLPEYHRC